MVFEYVVSGMTMGAPLGYWGDTEKLSAFKGVISNKVKDMRNRYERQEFSLLYNAFQEPKHGEAVFNNDLGFHHLFSDSGGLQMVTTKSGVTPELKDKVYHHQARYSDKAFIFDEIPLHVDRNLSFGIESKNNSLGKYFVRDMIVPSAEKTADNIKRQIEVFDSLNSSAKIFLISQGQDADSYNQYLGTIINRLSDYEMSRIYGIALSSACMGTKTLERFDMIYNYVNLELPENIKQNVHLLGVGNISTIFPFLYNKEYFKDIKTLSYDSTRQTNSYLFKRYTDTEHRTHNLNDSDEVAHMMMQQYYYRNEHYFQQLGCPSYDFYVENSTKFSSMNEENKIKYWTEHCDISTQLYQIQHFFYIMEVIENFRHNVDLMMNDDFTNHHVIKNKEMLLLKNVRDFNDYLDWRNNVGKYLKSDRNVSVQSISDIKKVSKIDDWF